MKKNKLWLFAALFAAVVLVFTACGSDDDQPAGDETPDFGFDRPTPDDLGDVEVFEGTEVNVFLISHSPTSILDDGSFNQGAWDGIQQFVAANPGTVYDFLQPHEASDAARIDMIADAVERGANVLILPGFDFIASVSEAQYIFPDVKFVLLDASPETFAPNTIAIHYAEEQAGFLAGYAAVTEGYRSLGFMGGRAVPAVVRFGHGFILGAEHAANSLGLDAGEVEVRFHYLDDFAPDPAHTTAAAAWFASGTEVIFVAAGGAGASVMAAAEGAGASVIGVDTDQSHLSDTVVTSAVKGLDVSVFDMLTAVRNGNWDGGQELRFDASNNGVNLIMGANSQLQNFTQAQLDAVFNEISTNNINVNASLDMADITTTLVTVIAQ